MTWIYIVIAAAIVALGIWVALRKEKKPEISEPTDSGTPPENPPQNPPETPTL